MPRKKASKKRTHESIEKPLTSSSSSASISTDQSSASSSINMELNSIELFMQQMQALIYKLLAVVEQQGEELATHEESMSLALPPLVTTISPNPFADSSYVDEFSFSGDVPAFDFNLPELELGINEGLRLSYRDEFKTKLDAVYEKVEQIEAGMAQVTVVLTDVTNRLENSRGKVTFEVPGRREQELLLLEEYRKTLAFLRNRVADLEHQLQSSEPKRSKADHELESMLLETQKKVRVLNSTLVKHKNTISDLTKLSMEKDKTISSLQEACAQHRQKMQSLETDLGKAKSDLGTYKEQSAIRLVQLFTEKDNELTAIKQLSELKSIPGQEQQSEPLRRILAKTLKAADIEVKLKLTLAKQAQKLAQQDAKIRDLEHRSKAAGEPILPIFTFSTAAATAVAPGNRANESTKKHATLKPS